MINKMWGGRFSSKTDKLLEEINASIKYDYRLAMHDIDGSIAHVEMLGSCSIITKEESKKIINGLLKIKSEIKNNNFNFKTELEDIHMNIENRLTGIIGAIAGKLHTARSRNDQVATDIRLYLKEIINDIMALIEECQKSLSKKAYDNYDTIMPGYTHMQIAQPITFGHHLLAYVELLDRDKSRFKDSLERIDECPLGSAAIAGTSFPIDRFMTSKKLGFKKPMANSMDAVSSRDVILEMLSNMSILSINLSRLSEEIILWVSSEFRFINLSDALTTGSSIMPQKKNPDGAEIIRSKAGRVIGSLNTLFIVLKGLPLAYSKDLQEDKEALFDAIDNIEISLKVINLLINDMEPIKENMLLAAEKGYSTATDIADLLAQDLNIPFREAHKIVGSIVSYGEKSNKKIKELSLVEFQKIDKRITKELLNKISFNSIIQNKISYGGTAPINVKNEAEKWLKILGV